MKLALVALLGIGFAACGAPSGIDAYGDREHSPTALRTALLPDVVTARTALDAGDAIGARKILEGLCSRAPADLALAIMLQEAEISAGEDLSALRERYLSLAREKDDANAWVLAARLEATPAEARALLERATRLDPKNVWAHYAQGFVEARDGSWSEAQVHLKQALELDPANLPARRLEAALLARDGKFEEARVAFGAWLEASKDDPRVEPASRVAVELDLAIVELEAGEPRAARTRLAALPVGSDATGSAARRLCILAATEQSLGHSELALAAARESEAIAPQSVLPKVQQALLHEEWLKDPDAAKAAWGRVLSEARTSGDLSDLIQSMRARVVLERLDAGVPSAKPAR